MIRLTLVTIALIANGPAAAELTAQRRANLPEQEAIEMATAKYIATRHQPLLAGWGVDSSWALDPHVYAHPRPAGGPTRTDYLRAIDAIARLARGQPPAQLSSEMVNGRTAAHLHIHYRLPTIDYRPEPTLTAASQFAAIPE